MPKINRIRIVNFAYNNEIREIPDLTLSFYDGESALINLSNGGGKSVLVELILQAVVPDLMIQKRKMSSFFRRGSRPSYLIIEWKLDREKNPDYLMTGIAMTGGNADDRLNGGLSYFTFGSRYERANEFDIAALPLSKVENESRTFMSFEKARDHVRTEAGKRPEAFYFAKSDVAAYRKKLEEFHIYQDEWRNIIARMNDEEGGIEGLFARCADSDQLVSQWIVRTVEKALGAELGEDLRTSIPDLTLDLVEETRRNQEDIKACAELRQFLKEQEPVKEALSGAVQSLQAEEAAETEVRTLIGLLLREKDSLSGEISQAEEEEQELSRKRRRIDDEEVSGKYLQAEKEKDEAARALSDAEEALRIRTEEVKSAAYEVAVLDGAEKYGRLQKALGRIQALMVEQDEAEGKGSRGDRLKNLGWTLRRFLEEREKSLAEEAEKTHQALDEADARKEALRREDLALQEENVSLEKESARLEVQKSQFEAAEEALERRVGAAFSRDLFGRLEMKDFEAVLSSERKTLGIALAEHEALQKESGELEKRHSELVDQILIQNQMRAQQERDQSLAKERLEDYEKALSGLKELSRLYDFREDSVFHKEAFAASLEEKRDALKERQNGDVVGKNSVEGLLEGIASGKVYLERDFLRRLDEQKIPYQTGEEYLDSLPAEQRLSLLASNPLLPFSILLEKAKDREIFSNLKMEGVLLRQIVPVLTYSEIRSGEAPLEGEALEGLSVLEAESGNLLISRDRRLFDDSLREAYKQQLIQTDSRLTDAIRKREAEIGRVSEGIRQIRAFPYGEDSEKKLTEDLQRCQEEIRKTDQELQNLQERREAFEKRRLSLPQDLEAARQKVDALEALDQDLDDFLVKNEAYEQDVEKALDVREKIQSIRKRFSEIGEEILSLDQKVRDLTARKAEIQAERKSCMNEFARYAHCMDGELVPGREDALREEYNQLEGELTADLKRIQRELKEQNAVKEELITQLNHSGITEEELSAVTYTEEAWQAAKRREAAAGKKRETAEKVRTEAYANDKTKGHTLSIVRTALTEQGLDSPLPGEEIFGNFEERRQKIAADQRALREREERLKSRGNLCESSAEMLGQTLPLSKREGALDPELRLKENIKKQVRELSEAYKAAGTERERCLRHYDSSLLDLKAKYINPHPTIGEILLSLRRLGEAETLTAELPRRELEILEQKDAMLDKLIATFEAQFSHMEDTKRQVFDQCMIYARQIYEGVRKVSDLSKIRLEGKSRPVQMLRIHVPQFVDEAVSRERIVHYVDELVNSLVNPREEDLREQDSLKQALLKKISSQMSGRVLLEQYIGRNSIPVEVYKVELNQELSGLKNWEDAMKQNSGGERFVCFFTVVATLIAYTRRMQGDFSQGENGNPGKVLLMDNPFGKTSSGHLLKAVMDIAKTFNMQLVCFSDLDQSSITNRFRLIIKLAVRSRLYSNRETLTVEKIQAENLQKNEFLEGAFVHQTYEQLSFW